MQSNDFQSWLVVSFDYGKSDLSDLIKYQQELEAIINPSGLGEVDGHEVATDLSDGTYWIVCSDPIKVFNLIKDSLTQTALVKIKEVKKREANEESYSVILSNLR